MFLTKLGDISGKTPDEKISIIENTLRANYEELYYILTHLDSSNVIELDIAKTKIYKGEGNEL